MTSLYIRPAHVIGKPLRRLELGQKIYVLDSEFKKVTIGKSYLLEATPNTIGRIVSDNMLRRGGAVSADHCQTLFKDPIYSIREIVVRSGGKRRSTRNYRKSRKSKTRRNRK